MSGKKPAPITGANEGIGLAAARELGARGVVVLLAPRAKVERDAGRLGILIGNSGISVAATEQATISGLRRVYETKVLGASAVASISSGLGSLTHVTDGGSSSRPPEKPAPLLASMVLEADRSWNGGLLGENGAVPW
jgi:NAD(P)-dependent dehydrogenase (short-subunit alcohol dehydrogenase family)